MGIEEVRRALFEGRDHIVSAPATAAAQRWQYLPIEQVGTSIEEIVTLLAGIHAHTQVALSISAEVQKGFGQGVEKVAAASVGADSPFSEIVSTMVRGVVPLVGIPLHIGNELGAVYSEIAAHLGSLQHLVEAAKNMRDAAAGASEAVAQGAVALSGMIEAHADSFITWEE